MEPDEPLSDTVAGKLRELFGWLPLGLISLFVLSLVFIHFFEAGMKANRGPNGYLLMNIETESANAAWNWVNTHLGLGWTYCALLLVASFYLSKARHKILAAALLVALLQPALWYFKEASYLGGKFVRW
jgi:hypothetical protein